MCCCLAKIHYRLLGSGNNCQSERLDHASQRTSPNRKTEIEAKGNALT